MKKKKKIIIIIVIVLIIFLLFIIGHIKHQNSDFKNIDDFYSIRELVEYYECVYYNTVNSSEENYSKDIYISFGYTPIDDVGEVNKYYYENIISLVSAKMNKKNYRIIDEQKKLIVRVRFKDDKIYYTINGSSNYFADIKSNYSIDNSLEEKTIEIEVLSEELKSIIDNEWSRKKSNLGKLIEEQENYDVYEDGYKVRTLGAKIYNIVFTEDYNKEVFKNITTGMDNTQIVKILGKPLYENEDENLLKGYKTKDFYIFFKKGEISIYRTEEFDQNKNEEFAKIFTDLCKTGNYNQFLDKLTDIYPNYSEYSMEDGKIDIKYPLLGFEIKMGYEKQNGLILYNNYKGKVTDSLTIEQIKQSKELPKNIYLELNSNLVFEEELERTIQIVKEENNV